MGDAEGAANDPVPPAGKRNAPAVTPAKSAVVRRLAKIIERTFLFGPRDRSPTPQPASEADERLEANEPRLENSQRRPDSRVRGRFAQHRVRVQHVEQAQLRRDLHFLEAERLR